MMDIPVNTQDVMKEVPTLDPQHLQVRLDNRGRLAITMPDGSLHTGARLYPAFPISRRRRFIYFYNEDNQELGILEDPKLLDAESRDLVIKECDQVYFMPRITRIMHVYERNSIAYWRVETDRGTHAFQVVSRSESIWYVGRNRLLIRDVDGNRYMIPDLTALDRRSRHIADLNI